MLGGNGMADRDRSVVGAVGIADRDRSVTGAVGMAVQSSAMLGGGGIAEHNSLVVGGGGIAEQDNEMLGGGGIAVPINAILGGGGTTGPERARSSASCEVEVRDPFLPGSILLCCVLPSVQTRVPLPNNVDTNPPHRGPSCPRSPVPTASPGDPPRPAVP
jgi:hypothetical protein